MVLKIRTFLNIFIAVFLFCCSATTVNAKVYAVCVGVNKYKERDIPPLKYAESDANSFTTFLNSVAPSASITMLTGSDATKDNIVNALTKYANLATSNDVIMFYFSGHGLGGGMAVYDTKSTKTCLRYRDLSNILKKSKVKNKFIFADTCHSGSGRLAKSNKDDSSHLNKQNILLFLSSRDNETSIENRFEGYGIFTRHLLDGLRGKADSNKDKLVTAIELFQYVSPQVISETGKRQHPVMWGNFDPNIVLMRLSR